jgi:hypothetical protein
MHSLYVDAGPDLFRDSHEIDDGRVRKFEVQILGARLILTRKRYNIGLLNRKIEAVISGKCRSRRAHKYYTGGGIFFNEKVQNVPYNQMTRMRRMLANPER